MIRVLAWPVGSADDLNPYVRLMYVRFIPPAATILAYRPLMRQVPDADIFHLQWPEGIFEGRGGTMPLIAGAKAWRVVSTADTIRRRGGKVVLTAHNLNPHAALSGWQQRLYNRYFAALLDRVDLVIALTDEALALFRASYPTVAATPARVVPHPHYRDSYAPTLPRDEARATFGMTPDATVIGMIGSIRPSKNVPDAIALFRRIGRDDERLLIAGECSDDGLWNALLRAADGDPRVVIRRGRLSDVDMANAFAAIDVCLIHQRQTLNSGTALMALSMNVPVVAPAVGSLPQLAQTVGDRWMALVAVDGDDTDNRRALDVAATVKGQRCDALDPFDPDTMSLFMLEIFKGLVHKPAP